MRRVLPFLLGWVFIVLGFLGLFLPILQGILFLTIGIALLASVWRPVWALVNRIEKRFPAIGRRAQRIVALIQRFFGLEDFPARSERKESRRSRVKKRSQRAR